MKMELKFATEEVKEIITEHVKTMLSGYLDNKDIDVSFSSYGHEAEVTITEKPEKKEIIDNLEAGDHSQIPLESEAA